MTFFISAISEDGKDVLAQEIDVETFEEAVSQLHVMGLQRWPGQLWRPTSVTEKPDRGPIQLAVILGGRAA